MRCNRNVRYGVIWLPLFGFLCMGVTPPLHALDEEWASLFEDAPSAISQDDLNRIPFQTRLHPEADHWTPLDSAAILEEAQIALFMPETSHAVGEPIYAYFMVKNNQQEKLGLDMRLDLHQATTVNSCGIYLQQSEGEPSEIGHSALDELRGDPPVVNPAGGYYCVRGDLRNFGALNPGRYQISWYYGPLQSQEIEFSISPSPGHAAEKPAPVYYNLAYVESGFSRDGERIEYQEAGPAGEASPLGVPIVLSPTSLFAWHDPLDVEVALATGVEGKHYCDILALPSRDEFIQTSAQFLPCEEEGVPNRVRLTLEPGPQIMGERGEGEDRLFFEKEDLHIMIMAVSSNESSIRLSRETENVAIEFSRWQQEIFEPWLDDHNNPVHIDVDLPEDWPTQLGLIGPGKICFIISSEWVKPTSLRGLEELQEMVRGPGRKPWRGLLCTPPIEIDPLSD